MRRATASSSVASGTVEDQSKTHQIVTLLGQGILFLHDELSICKSGDGAGCRSTHSQTKPNQTGSEPKAQMDGTETHNIGGEERSSKLA